MINTEQHAPAASAAPDESFQARVQPWMMACFGAAIAADGAERNHRFLEESLELVQACGCTASDAHQLVDYVYGRPVGERAQEVGGVMVTLAALCLAQRLDMHAAGETELARIWTKVNAIRAKQAARPKHSPLPAAPTQAQEPIGYINPVFLTERRSEFEQNGTVMFAWQCGECTNPIYGIAAPVQPVAVPNGWKLVPIEPTIEMIAALGWGGDEILAMGHAAISKGISDQYAAMLAVSPAAPAAQGDAKDSERLDFIVKEDAFIVWKKRDDTILQCQLMNQDEDEDFRTISGPEDRYFNTPRAAIDAAITAKAAS